MKKIITLTLIGALVLGMAFAGTVNAESPKDKARGMSQMGTVERISANSVILKAPGMDFITIEITTNNETKFFDGTVDHEKGELPPEIKWNEIKKDDKVVARGKMVREDEESKTSYLAISVTKISQFPQPKKPGGDKGRREAPPTMNALFKSVSGDTLTVTDPSGEKEFEVTLLDETKFAKVTKDDDGKPNREEIALGDLKDGDKLVINAKREKDDDGNVTITARFVMVVDEFPPKNDKGRDDKRNKSILGTFTGFDGEYMVLSPVAEDREDIKIKLGEKTKYVAFEKGAEGEKPTKIDKTKDDLSSGQKVSVQVINVKGEGDTREFTAVLVVFLDEFPPARAGGEITSINANSITIQMRNEETTTFEITDETKFEIHARDTEPVEAKKADFKKGDMVGIMFRDGVALLITKRAEK